MTETYDVVVIGAGPGGYVAAIRAAQLGQKTAIVDKQWLGGVCLNVGCIPSKALLKNAEVAHTLRERGKEFGFSFDNLNLDFSVAVKRSRQVSNRLVKGVGFLMKKNGIDVYMGSAHLSAPGSVTVTDEEGKATDAIRQKHHRGDGCFHDGAPGLESGRRESRHLSGSHPAGETAQVCDHHRRGRDRRGIRHRLEFLRLRRDHRRDAAQSGPAGR